MPGSKATFPVPRVSGAQLQGTVRSTARCRDLRRRTSLSGRTLNLAVTAGKTGSLKNSFFEQHTRTLRAALIDGPIADFNSGVAIPRQVALSVSSLIRRACRVLGDPRALSASEARVSVE